jgi:hypothetical protein
MFRPHVLLLLGFLALAYFKTPQILGFIERVAATRAASSCAANVPTDGLTPRS